MVKLSYAHIGNHEEARKNFGACYNQCFLFAGFYQFLNSGGTKSSHSLAC